MSAVVHGHIGASTLPRLAAAVLERVDDLADELVEELRSHDAAYGADVVPRDDLWRSCYDNLVRVIGHLVEQPTDVEAAFAPPRGTGRRRAEQRFPLENLLHAYRVGGRIIWESLLREARLEQHRSTEQLAESASQVWDVIDAYSAVVGEAYRTREAELQRFDQERRLTLLDGLLEGRGREPRFGREALSALDLPAAGSFVVAVVRHAGQGVASSPPARTELRAAWRLRSNQHVGIVPLERQPLDRIRQTLAAFASGPVGISPAVGLADLAEALRWAELAVATAGSGEVVMLDDRLAAALIASEPELGKRLVHRVFGALADLDADERDRLLETLDVYLDNSFSIAVTASRLFCHRNTVANRLRRFESVTGRSLDDQRDLLDVGLARMATRLGPSST